MIEDIKIKLDDAAAAFTDAQIELAIRQAEQEAALYCRRPLDDDLAFIAQKMAIVSLNRTNTEGLAGQSIAGVNENYIDGMPQDIITLLNRKRKVKFI